MKKTDPFTCTFIKAIFRVRILLLAIFISFSNFVLASPNSLTYQGRIVKANGTPLEYNSVSFQFEITSPDGLCVVYREQVNGIDMTNSGGVFDVAIGGGTQSYPNNGTFSLLDTFNNTTTFTCDGGSTYLAAAGDYRKLRVKFHDGVGWKTIAPDSEIRSVPFAGYALSAQKLGNNVAGDFLTKAGLPTCTAGTFLSWDGTALSCIPIAGASGGTVTNVTSANSYISIVNNTSTPIVTLNVGTAVNTVAAGNDTRIVNAMQAGAAAGGDLSGTYPNPKVAQIQGTAVSNSAPANGQFFKFNGTSWVPTAIATGDVSGLAASLSSYLSQAAFNGYVASAGCGVSQTMYWNSVSSNFQCQAINVSLVGDVTGTIGAAKVVALQNYSVDTTAPTNNQVLQWNGTKWAPATLPAGNSGTVTSVSGTLPISVATGTSTPVISISQATTTTNGYLSSADWNTFNGKQAAGNYVKNGGGVGTITADVDANKPASPAAGDMFVATDTNKVYQYNSGSWALISSAGAGATFSGDVSGAYNATSVDKIKGKTVAPVAYSAGQHLRYDGTNWVNSLLALSTDVTGTLPVANGGTGATTISSGNLMVGAGTGAVTSLAAGSAGNVVYATGITTWASGTADTAGLVDKTNTQTISGAKAFTTYLQLSASNEIRFADADSSNYVGFKSPATVAANKVWVLPAADGTNGQILTTDGAGALSWSTASAGGSLPAAAGTAAAPGYAFSGDTNTGMFGASADVLGFSTNGTERVRISSSGNVGIGTATPSGILDVQGGSAAANTAGTSITLKAQNATGPAGGVGGNIFLNPGDGAGSWPGGSVLISTTDGQNGAINASNNTTSGYVTSSGATSSPSFVLQLGNNYNLDNNTALIDGSVKNSSSLYQDGYMGFVSVTGAANYSPDFVMGMSTGANAYQERIRVIGSSGNVGIGTATPASKLDVAGSVRVGTDATACAAGISGAIRYSAGFAEYCNGSTWQKLAGYTGTAANGQLLIGNGTGFGLANITQGAGITITNSAGGITIAASGGGGGVTSVSSSSTDIAVATGTTTPLLTLNSGTSGGAGDADKIPKMNSSGQLAAAMIPNLDASKTTSGVFPIARGGTNSSNALANNRIMASSGGAIVEAAGINANKALISDANGIPTHSAVTDTELGYLAGVTSSVQTQINAKTSSSGWTNYSAMGVNGAGALTAIPGSTSGSILNWTVTGPAWTTASFPTSTTANQLLYSSANNVVGGLPSANNSILTTDGSGVPTWSSFSGDSFTQYVLLAGRAGGQTISGGNAASNNLTLDSTTHATKGNILLATGNGSVGIGTSTPSASAKLEVNGLIYTSNNIFGGKIVGGGISAGYNPPARAISSGGGYGVAYTTTSSSQDSPAHVYSISSRNSSTSNTAGAFYELAVANSSSLNQSAYIGAISNAGAAAYTPTIVFGQQTGATAYNERMRIESTGNVGIGTTTPASKLQVSGAVTNTVSTFSGAFTCGTSTIDFSTSNFQRLSPSGAIAAGSCTTTLSNMVAGGSYTLVMTGNAVTNAVLYSFSGYTFKYLPANAAITAGKDAIYTFLYDGTTVYVTWAGGY